MRAGVLSRLTQTCPNGGLPQLRARLPKSAASLLPSRLSRPALPRSPLKTPTAHNHSAQCHPHPMLSALIAHINPETPRKSSAAHPSLGREPTNGASCSVTPNAGTRPESPRVILACSARRQRCTCPLPNSAHPVQARRMRFLPAPMTQRARPLSPIPG